MLCSSLCLSLHGQQGKGDNLLQHNALLLIGFCFHWYIWTSTSEWISTTFMFIQVLTWKSGWSSLPLISTWTISNCDSKSNPVVQNETHAFLSAKGNGTDVAGAGFLKGSCFLEFLTASEACFIITGACPYGHLCLACFVKACFVTGVYFIDMSTATKACFIGNLAATKACFIEASTAAENCFWAPLVTGMVAIWSLGTSYWACNACC